MKASFETVSSIKPTKIFITAEVGGIVQYPDSQIVLTTDKLEKRICQYFGRK
jgi:hypothetical protein